MALSIKARDRIGAAALIAWNSAALVGVAIKITRAVSDAGAAALPQCLSLGTSAAVLVLQMYFLAIRSPSVARTPGLLPRACALLGAYIPATFVLLPTTASKELQLAAALVTTMGTVGVIYALAHLGSAFSVFPQARRLVTTGPYRVIRHPLYLFGEVSVVGIALGYMQPWALLLAGLSLLLQFPRMAYEERILAVTFEDYAAYLARTSRLIPGLY